MRAANTFRPACSKRRYTSPIRLRPTPSGLTMDRVRSMDMGTSRNCGLRAPWEAGKDCEVYWSGDTQAIRTITEVPVLHGKTRLAAFGNRRLNVETLAAAA